MGKLVWDNQGAVDEKGPGEMEVFPAFHAVPFSKMLTFFKSDTFKVAGEYSGPVPFPDQHIGNFEVGEVQPTAEGGNQKVKVKVRINPSLPSSHLPPSRQGLPPQSHVFQP